MHEDGTILVHIDKFILVMNYKKMIIIMLTVNPALHKARLKMRVDTSDSTTVNPALHKARLKTGAGSYITR